VRTSTVDVVIVGGGPAGLAAARRLSRLHAGTVVVVERETQAGGVPRHCDHPSFGLKEFGRPMSGPRYAAAILNRAIDDSVEIRTGTTVLEVGRDERPYVIATSPLGLERWDAGAVLLATGCRERPRSARLIPGSRSPGVYTTSELQQFTYLHRISVGRRAVVVGAEHVSFSALMTLRDAGIDCAAVVTEFAEHQSYPLLRLWATKLGRIPVLRQHRVASIEGGSRVERVHLESPGGSTTIECDTVIMTGDWVAEGALAHHAGLSDDTRNGGRPGVTRQGATNTEGIFAAGSLVSPGESAASATRAGTTVAETVARFLGHEAPSTSSHKLRWLHPIRWVSPQLTSVTQPAPVQLRVDKWIERPTVVFRSNGRVVDTVRLRRMIPGRTYTINGSWADRLDDGAGDVHVSIGAT
jgi:thioredoxin reductase